MHKFNSERNLAEQVARYLQIQYPNVIYRFDLAADLKLTVGQAARHKRLHPRRAYPDLFIAEPCIVKEIDRMFNDTIIYTLHGLYLELKKDGTRLKKKNGEWATEHIKEQAEMLEKLNIKGYRAKFAIGFDHAKTIIDNYLKGLK